MIEITNTTKAPAAIGPYSQAMKIDGFLFASGQIPINPETGEICGSTIEEQTLQVMKNVYAILEANDMSFANVIKTTCYLSDMKDFASFNTIYAKYFISKPARSCVAVREIPKGVLCEVEITAHK